MNAPLDVISIQGYKSIRNLESLSLNNLNILVGANGAGKSNFLAVFELLRKLTLFRGVSELADAFGPEWFFGGPETTDEIKIRARFGFDGYDLELFESDARPSVCEKAFRFTQNGEEVLERVSLSSRNSLLHDGSLDPYFASRPDSIRRVSDSIKSLRSYKFRKADSEKATRCRRDLVDLETLDDRAEHLASFLYFLRRNHSDSYQETVRCLRLALPFFDDFVLEPDEQNRVRLDWRHKKFAARAFSPAALSVGAFQFACLATALLQPNLPSILLIDGPENDWHSTTLGLLAELIQGAARRTQVIVATQSPELLDSFQPEDVIVANRRDGASTYERLDRSDLNVWLEDYTLGELFRGNIIANAPSYEG